MGTCPRSPSDNTSRLYQSGRPDFLQSTKPIHCRMQASMLEERVMVVAFLKWPEEGGFLVKVLLESAKVSFSQQHLPEPKP